MPLYRFTGLASQVYPETRDALDRPLGLVEPGDERDFGQAPDHLWVPVSGGSGIDGEETPAAAAAGDASEDPGGTGEQTAPPEAPAGPVPAPPAVIPGS